jgi:hypothetical protein
MRAAGLAVTGDGLPRHGDWPSLRGTDDQGGWRTLPLKSLNWLMMLRKSG